MPAPRVPSLGPVPLPRGLRRKREARVRPATGSLPLHSLGASNSSVPPQGLGQPGAVPGLGLRCTQGPAARV